MKWSQRLVFISVCHSACLSCRLPLLSLFSCLPHFPSPFPFIPPTSPSNRPLLSSFSLVSPSTLQSLSHSICLSGSELGAVEGPPDYPRLHRDEDPTRGGHVQQEEAIVGGQREEQNRKPPKEIIEHLPLKPLHQSHQPAITLDLGVSVHMYIHMFLLVYMPVCVSTLGQYVHFWGREKCSYAIVTYYLFIYNEIQQKFLALVWLWESGAQKVVLKWTVVEHLVYQL